MSSIRGGFGGGTRPGTPTFYFKKMFRTLYLPLYQYFSSCMDLKCLFYVCVTVILNHTCPLLSQYHIRPPKFKNARSAPDYYGRQIKLF